jgi:hypothetical protein
MCVSALDFQEVRIQQTSESVVYLGLGGQATGLESPYDIRNLVRVPRRCFVVVPRSRFGQKRLPFWGLVTLAARRTGTHSALGEGSEDEGVGAFIDECSL